MIGLIFLVVRMILMTWEQLYVLYLGKSGERVFCFLAIIFRLLDVAYISKILFSFGLLKVKCALSLVLSKAMPPGGY